MEFAQLTDKMEVPRTKSDKPGLPGKVADGQAWLQACREILAEKDLLHLSEEKQQAIPAGLAVLLLANTSAAAGEEKAAENMVQTEEGEIQDKPTAVDKHLMNNTRLTWPFEVQLAGSNEDSESNEEIKVTPQVASEEQQVLEELLMEATGRTSEEIPESADELKSVMAQKMQTSAEETRLSLFAVSDQSEEEGLQSGPENHVRDHPSAEVKTEPTTKGSQDLLYESTGENQQETEAPDGKRPMQDIAVDTADTSGDTKSAPASAEETEIGQKKHPTAEEQNPGVETAEQPTQLRNQRRATSVSLENAVEQADQMDTSDKLSTNDSSVRLRLSDGETNQLTLQMRTSGNHLTGRLRTADGQLLQQLSDRMPDLRQNLRSLGYAQVDIQLGADGSSGGRYGTRSWDDQKHGTSGRLPQSVEGAEPVQKTKSLSMNNSSQIDLLA